MAMSCLLKHFWAYSPTFDWAFLVVINIFVDSFMSLVIIWWQRYCTTDVNKNSWERDHLLFGIWEYSLLESIASENRSPGWTAHSWGSWVPSLCCHKESQTVSFLAAERCSDASLSVQRFNVTFSTQINSSSPIFVTDWLNVLASLSTSPTGSGVVFFNISPPNHTHLLRLS